MGRIRRTLDLAKASWGVLKQDRELVWLPAIAFVVSVVVAAAVLVPIALTTDLDAAQGEQSVSGLTVVLLILLSLAITVISVFFKGALVSGANERLTGGDPTVASAIGGALARFHRLLPWALLTGTVGLVLQVVRERSGMLGRIVVGFIGGAWEVVTFLVVPVIIVEGTGPVDSVKTSAELFRRTWGENLAARIGFGLLGFVAIIPMILLGAAGAAIGSIIGFLLIAAAVVGVAGVAAVLSALGAIFQTALYHYAVGNTAVTGFDPAVLRDSFANR